MRIDVHGEWVQFLLLYLSVQFVIELAYAIFQLFRSGVKWLGRKSVSLDE